MKMKVHFGTAKGNGLVRFGYVKVEYATEHQLYETGETCFLFPQQVKSKRCVFCTQKRHFVCRIDA